MTKSGMDIDLVQAMGVTMQRQADHITNTLVPTLDRVVSQIPGVWRGPDAERFVQWWRGKHREGLLTVGKDLHGLGQAALNNAAEQARASGVGVSAGDLGGSGQSAELSGIAAGLSNTLADMGGRTNAEQLAWWQSLTGQQQEALLAFSFAGLLALRGLPADVISRAQLRYASSIASQVKVRSTSLAVEGKVSVKVIEVGASMDVEQTTFADGHVEVDLRPAVGIGGSLEFVELAAEGDVSGVYSFASEQEAQAFLDQLRKEVAPSAKELLQAGGSYAGASAASLVSFLASKSSHLQSVATSGGLGAEGKIHGVMQVSQDAGVSLSVDTGSDGQGAGDVTLKASGSVSGKAHGALFGVTGEMQVSAALTTNGADLKSLVFTQTFEAGSLVGVFTPVAEGSLSSAISGSAEVSFDLTDPEVGAAAKQAADALARGDVVGAAGAMGDVLDRARVVLQVAEVTEKRGEVDAFVVSGGVKSSTSQVTATYIKPPGGAIYEVR